MPDSTRLRELLRHRSGRPAAPRRAASPELDALAAGLGGGLEDAPLGSCPVVRWWLGNHGDNADNADDDPYRGDLGRASRAISPEALRVLCGAGDRGQAPWSGVDPTAGLVFFDLETTGLSGGAGTVAFVASEDACQITGESIRVDGATLS